MQIQCRPMLRYRLDWGSAGYAADGARLESKTHEAHRLARWASGFRSLRRRRSSERVNGRGLDGRPGADDGSYINRRGDGADLARQRHLLGWRDGLGSRIVGRARDDGRWGDRAWSNRSTVAAGRATGVTA